MSIRSHADCNLRLGPTVGWEVLDASGVEPVFQVKAIGMLQSFTASQLLPSGAPIRRGCRESQARRQY